MVLLYLAGPVILYPAALAVSWYPVHDDRPLHVLMDSTTSCRCVPRYFGQCCTPAIRIEYFHRWEEQG